MMNALPSFAQLQPPPSGQAAASANTTLSLLTGDGGGMGPFDALFAQNQAAALQNSPENSPHPTGSGQFQDIGVIMQLLRSAQSSAASGPAEAMVSNAALMADIAADGSNLPNLPLPATTVETALPAADIAPIPAPLASPPAAAPLSTASMQDVLDMAARLAMAHHQTPSSDPALPVDPDAPLVVDAPVPSTADLQAAMQKLIGDQPVTAPAQTAPTPSSSASEEQATEAPPQTTETPLSDTAQPKQAEALDILLSLALPAAAASAGSAHNPVPVSQGKASAPISAPAAALENSALTSEDGAVSLPASAPKPQPLTATAAVPAKAPSAQPAEAGVVPAPTTPRAAAPTPNPILAAAAPATNAPTTPSADIGAAMQVILSPAGGPTATAPAAPTAETAAVPEHWLDMSSDDAWIEQLAKDIAATKSLTGDLTFRLMPRHLGRLDVSMMQNDQGVSVRMEAQQENTAAIVAAAQGRLVDELRQQGVRVAGAETTHMPQDAARQQGQGQNHNSNSKVNINHLIETESKRLPESNSDEKGPIDRSGRFA